MRMRGWVAGWRVGHSPSSCWMRWARCPPICSILSSVAGAWPWSCGCAMGMWWRGWSGFRGGLSGGRSGWRVIPRPSHRPTPRWGNPNARPKRPSHRPPPPPGHLAATPCSPRLNSWSGGNGGHPRPLRLRIKRRPSKKHCTILGWKRPSFSTKSAQPLPNLGFSRAMWCARGQMASSTNTKFALTRLWG